MLIKILVLPRFLVFYSAKNYVSSSFFPFLHGFLAETWTVSSFVQLES